MPSACRVSGIALAVVQQNRAARRRHRRRDRAARPRCRVIAATSPPGRPCAARGRCRRGSGTRAPSLSTVGRSTTVSVKRRRLDAVRLDVVLGRLLEVEQHALERCRARRAATSGTRSNAPLGVAAHHQRRVARREADQLGLDRLIGAARHLGVARRDLDPVRAGRFGAARDDQQRRQACRRNAGPNVMSSAAAAAIAAERQQLAPHAVALDRAAVVERRGTARSPARRASRPGAASGRRSDPPSTVASTALRMRRLERRVAFLEIERDLRVGDAAAQRPDQADAQQPGEDGERDDAERDDGGGAEAQRLEARRPRAAAPAACRRRR